MGLGTRLHDVVPVVGLGARLHFAVTWALAHLHVEVIIRAIIAFIQMKVTTEYGSITVGIKQHNAISQNSLLSHTLNSISKRENLTLR